MGDGPSLRADAAAGNPYAIEAVEKAPKLDYPYLWHAFNSLHTERDFGMGAGPIPDSIMEAYARRDELNRLERETFMYALRVLDNEYLAIQAEKSRKSNN